MVLSCSSATYIYKCHIRIFIIFIALNLHILHEVTEKPLIKKHILKKQMFI